MPADAMLHEHSQAIHSQVLLLHVRFNWTNVINTLALVTDLMNIHFGLVFS